MSELKERIVEEEEKTPLFDAWFMKQGDVDMIMGEVTDAVRNAQKPFSAFMEGMKLDEVRDALNKAANTIKTGPLKEFIRKNGAMLKKNEAEFMNVNGENGAIEDRRAVLNLYKFITKTSDFTDAVCNYFEYFARVYAVTANEFFSFHNDLQAVLSADYIAHLGKVYHEYCYFFNKFNNASIYNDMEVSKNLAFEDNLKLVHEHMDYVISTLKNLSSVLTDSKHVNAYESNMSYILDRLTRDFEDYDKELKNGGDIMIDTGEKLNAQISGFVGQPGFSFALGYLKALEELVTKIGFVFVHAQEILKNYKSSSDAPYAIMRYDPNVQKAASTYLFVSLNDPVKSGTQYKELASQMVLRNNDLAKMVAKNAP